MSHDISVRDVIIGSRLSGFTAAIYDARNHVDRDDDAKGSP